MSQRGPEVHTPPNESPLDDIYVFLSVDEKGNRGICAWAVPGIGATPLVTGKRSIAKIMQKSAQEVSKLTGQRVGLYRFSRRTELWSTDD